MLIKLVRTFKAGWKNLIRNGSLAVATVGVITTALFIINIQGVTVFSNYKFLEDVKDKVSISVYVDTDVAEEEVLQIKKEIENYSEVSEVNYTSREDALSKFKDSTKDNKTIQKALDEIEDNPLGAVLNVKANNPDQYKEIASKIENSSAKDKLLAVNYRKYKKVIDNINQGIKSNQKIAFTLGITFSLIAILITFNSIKITMYVHQKEIEIMRLVGASNNYIRLPFLWEGIFYGLIATLIAVPLSYFYLDFVSSGGDSGALLPLSNSRFIEMFLRDYFVNNFFQILFSQILLGTLLGVLSSVIAIRRYLKV